jgi:tetratricopeptide (TPR) repeat protein
MSQKQVRGQYTQEFKLEAVRLVKTGQSVGMTAKVLGIPKASLSNWVRSSEQGQLGGAGGSHWTADGGTPVTVASGDTAAFKDMELIHELYHPELAMLPIGSHYVMSPAEAALAWDRVTEVAPERAYLAFNRLEALYRSQNAQDRFQALCRRLIEANPKDWRAHLALARNIMSEGRTADALELLFEALSHSPHALTIHQEIWQALVASGLTPTLISRYTELTRQSVFYLDPHICQRCHYRSTELLWQCPHCHEWDTFVEDRIAPAQDAAAAEPDAPAALP